MNRPLIAEDHEIIRAQMQKAYGHCVGVPGFWQCADDLLKNGRCWAPAYQAGGARQYVRGEQLDIIA